MPSPRPRSNRSRSPRSSARGESQGERARLRRNRPLTWRTALLLLVPLALLAAGFDLALYASVSDHYARHGHLSLPLDVAFGALALTTLTVYGCFAVGKELRKGKHNSKAGTPLDAAIRKKEPRRPS